MATSALLNGIANFTGQVVGALVEDTPCDITKVEYFREEFNPYAVGGAAIAGAFAPLWSSISVDIFGGSAIVQGAMGGAFTAYNEIAWSRLGSY